MFKRILIANRGEIALRIMRACREMGIETVCVYSTADKDAPYLKLADRAICIGPGGRRRSRTSTSPHHRRGGDRRCGRDPPRLRLPLRARGLLAGCRDCKIEFIGPTPEAMGKLGDKVECKKTAKAAKVPIFPGSEGAIEDEEEAVKVANKIGYPVIIKAAAGGGGRGMRSAATRRRCAPTSRRGASQEPSRRSATARSSSRSSSSTRGTSRCRCLGDKHGTRSISGSATAPCSAATRRSSRRRRAEHRPQEARRGVRGRGAADQERELPRGGDRRVPDGRQAELLHARGEHARAGRAPGDGDDHGRRHREDVDPVAAGERIPYKQKDITIRGHAMECRINAEDPDKGFRPSAGKINTFEPPGGLGVRLDTHVVTGYVVPPNYDSMIGKLICGRDDREQCMDRMARALREFRVGPDQDDDPAAHAADGRTGDFRKGGVDIHYLGAVAKVGWGSAMRDGSQPEEAEKFFRVDHLPTRFPALAKRLETSTIAAEMTRARDRVLRDNDIVLNKCPRCGELCLTPRARACLDCGHTWHSD
jgi:acetyl-CoA carboxylase biotin carboxylase subunit